ncbi:hypothetical protein [Primorskyibacter aestuariivivens]|uniref:hypothetical protein n=1 Tax=Primorskyibacter aestuariivivens TaxID=1888912 RepID=UPI0023000BD7|nr:hypothetical protein [Primorskyibacter aestuariivivens]MDA7429204.1 hypothetical protein [Primorskyibacter aestuariivivens]
MPTERANSIFLAVAAALGLGAVLVVVAKAPIWVPLLVIVLAALLLSVLASQRLIRIFRATRPERRIRWRLVRTCILVFLRPAFFAVLSSREIAGSNGPQRLLAGQIDRLFYAIEPMAQQLRIHASLAELPSFGNRLMVELSVFTAAAHRVLLDAGFQPDHARSAVADAGWIVYSRMLRLSSLPFRLSSRDPATRLRRTIRALLWFPFHAPGAPGYAVLARSDDAGITTHFTHCPPQTFIRKLIDRDDRNDLEAFRQSWCRYDWPGADLIAGDGKRGHYERPHTLSHGDSVCDMCWRGQAGRHGLGQRKQHHDEVNHLAGVKTAEGGGYGEDY